MGGVSRDEARRKGAAGYDKVLDLDGFEYLTPTPYPGDGGSENL
jgi:hypothetical protein